MKVKLIPRKNPQDREAAPKYYAEPQNEGTISIDFIARQIAGRSSLTVGDIKNVLSNFLEEMPTYMLLGRSVKLNELGTFRISFSSEGAVEESAFKTSMIKGLKIIFTPDVTMKNRIKDGITYEVVRSKKGGPDDPENPFE